MLFYIGFINMYLGFKLLCFGIILSVMKFSVEGKKFNLEIVFGWEIVDVFFYYILVNFVKVILYLL